MVKPKTFKDLQRSEAYKEVVSSEIPLEIIIESDQEIENEQFDLPFGFYYKLVNNKFILTNDIIRHPIFTHLSKLDALSYIKFVKEVKEVIAYLFLKYDRIEWI